MAITSLKPLWSRNTGRSLPRCAKDLRTLSSEPTADVHTDGDAALDQVSLAEYLETRGAGPVIKQAIGAA
jgi:hypothetical protein